MVAGLVVLVGLGLLVVLHEVGHLLAARASGLRVTDFSVGLGPSLWARPVGTVTLRIGVVPFGGFVRVAELAPAGAVDPRTYPPESPADRFAVRPVLARLATIGAGSAVNLGAAAVLAAVVALRFGVETGRIEGLEVTSPAGGVSTGDVLTHVEGNRVRRVSELSPLLGTKGGAPVRASLRRGGEQLEVTVRPRRAGGRFGLGARYSPLPELRRPTLGEALAWGAAYPVRRAAELVGRVTSMVTPGSSVRLVSPVGVADRVARTGAWSARRVLLFAALLSVVVGLFNLLPLPGLDGGRLVIEAIETARRRRLPPRAAVAVQVGGALVLLVAWSAVVLSDLTGAH